MPSGKTHDRISLFFFIPFASIVWTLSKDWGFIVLFSVSYLFSCFMFSGDLDLVSIQSKRWGFFKWIWIPYRKMLSHRSSLSHGMLLGTVFRLFYLGIFLVIFYSLVYIVTVKYSPSTNTELLTKTEYTYKFLKAQNPMYFFTIFMGLLAGGALHTISDLIVSKVKRIINKRKRKKQKRKSKVLAKRR